jgi:preprotein translocase subunit SecA
MGFPIVSPILRKLLGTRNERMVKRYMRIVDQVNAYEAAIRPLTDAELRARGEEYRERMKKGEKAYDLIPEVFAVAREVMDRAVGIRNVFNSEHKFDPSLLSGEAREAFDRVHAEIARTEPATPTGAFLGCEAPVPAWVFVDIPVVLYDAVRALYPESKPPFRARPFDVQIIGGVVLYEGKIAEMKTGEGKTIVAPLATYLAVLEGRQVHVVTVNDYLVQRDRDWTFPFFRALGLTVGAIHPQHMQSPQGKRNAYACNVVYGTTSEFGFDFLRDNMKMSVAEQVQKKRDFAVVDEVDSILIDEARTPLIISGMAHQYQPRYQLADQLARHLVEKQREWDTADARVQSCLVEISGLEGDIRNARDKAKVPALKDRLDAARNRLPQLEADRDRFTRFYEVEMDKKRATLTHEGTAEAQRKAGVGSFYVGDNIDLPHLLENAIRAHAVYQRDRDYVVAPEKPGEDPGVIIVDQNTGRKMVGRQWSDGLHQAVEAKEGVRVKEETQTMATITVQNFFKMYKKLAGMTGTADTEATEFHEIYRLDVICIPTNVPVVRDDRQDRVYLSQKDKWAAIVEEIKRFHDAGRPVLVGTTSVEKSETLSEMLTKKYQIRHEVLNAKQHEREAEIVAGAGQLGAVMIATNMAGRGTDIKLGRVTREQLIEHWKRRSICPREVQPDWDDAKIVAACYRLIAPKELDLRKNEVDPMSDDQIRHALLARWATEHCLIADKKASAMSDDDLLAELDASGTCLLHRLRMYGSVEDLGGLHVIGTERHEARRIDNQLRGRSGRQGDRGSSRFFLSLEDDLMKMFAGETTLKVLSRLGMKEGDHIEAPILSRAVERAQRKVEERNFLWRKNILEYDEIMNVQRKAFYGTRQRILEGREIKELIFELIGDAVADSAATYLDKNYAATCMSEWVREKLGVLIEPDRLRGKDREDLHKAVTINAKEENAATLRVTLPEFLPPDGDRAEWDWKGLLDWANPRYKLDLKVDAVRDKSIEDLTRILEEAGDRLIDETDLTPLDQYLAPNFAHKEFANWANSKFDADLKPEDFKDLEDAEAAIEMVMSRAEAAYRRREITYPIDFALDMTTANLQRDPKAALEQLMNWSRMRYGVEFTPQTIVNTKPSEIRDRLLKAAEAWTDDRIAARAKDAFVKGREVETVEQWLVQNYAIRMTEEEREAFAANPESAVIDKIKAALRAELTQFERWILLQIYDTAWKDHLHAMDQVRDAIGFRSFSQKDPRIEFKREGARLFDEMQETVRQKVTDLIFKARLSPQVPARPARPPGAPGEATLPAGQAPAPQPARPAAPPQPAQHATAAAAALAARNRADAEQADRAGAGTATQDAPKQRRVPVTVGRNEPCPCGSGKKYKQCCGQKQ